MHNRKQLHLRMVAQSPRLTLFGHKITADDGDSVLNIPHDSARPCAAAAPQSPLPSRCEASTAERRQSKNAMAVLAERVSLYRCIFSDLRLAYGSISGVCDGMFEPQVLLNMLVWYRNATHDLLIGQSGAPSRGLSTAGFVNDFAYEVHCSQNVRVVYVFDKTFDVCPSQ